MTKPEMPYFPSQYLDYNRMLYSTRKTSPTLHRSLIWTLPNYFSEDTSSLSTHEIHSSAGIDAQGTLVSQVTPGEVDVSYCQKKKATSATSLCQVRVAKLQIEMAENIICVQVKQGINWVNTQRRVTAHY